MSAPELESTPHHEYDAPSSRRVAGPLLVAAGLISLAICTQTLRIPVVYKGVDYAAILTIGGALAGLSLAWAGGYLIATKRYFLSLHAHPVVGIYFALVLFFIQLAAYATIFIITHVLAAIQIE
ncbi:MAG TPA: hypothetical protein VMT30_06035 [Candidatus Saccharimonadia bacterium]|nr:hypothetical protein [Candidatus Saccharimonadia bacterium]